LERSSEKKNEAHDVDRALLAVGAALNVTPLSTFRPRGGRYRAGHAESGPPDALNSHPPAASPAPSGQTRAASRQQDQTTAFQTDSSRYGTTPWRPSLHLCHEGGTSRRSKSGQGLANQPT